MSTAAVTLATADLKALGFRLNFLKLIVSDMGRSERFYADCFGFAVSSRIDLPEIEETMLTLSGDRFTLVLYRNKDGRAVEIGSGHGPIGFLTRDVDAAFAHATAQGASPLRPPFTLGTMRIAFVTDPEGHEIEMIQILRAGA